MNHKNLKIECNIKFNNKLLWGLTIIIIFFFILFWTKRTKPIIIF